LGVLEGLDAEGRRSFSLDALTRTRETLAAARSREEVTQPALLGQLTT
jgi:putative transposase